jgi:hypothetical protein
MMFPNQDWANRQECSDEARREHERERLVLWTLDAIADQMMDAGMSKADVARKLETSRANVTQVLSGSRNATLGTVADFAWACGMRAVVKFEPLRSGAFISQPVVQVSSKPKVAFLRPNWHGSAEMSAVEAQEKQA